VPDDRVILKCSTCLRDALTKAWIVEECLPVPAFGEIASARVEVATVGLNPASNEFYAGNELKLPSERLPAFSDYGVTARNQLTAENVTDATRRRVDYFNGEARRAHDWFVRLGVILSTANADWSYGNGNAAHLDIVACATKQKWSKIDEDARKVLVANCRKHLESTVGGLPAKASLLFDGKTACEAMAGEENDEWIDLCQFKDADGGRKTVRVRSGFVAVSGTPKRFVAWNIPAKYLSDEALVSVGEWVRGAICGQVDFCGD
jgi:hypothetical protein